MNKPYLTPVEDNFFPFFEENPQVSPQTRWYKIYNDGSNYIASAVVKNERKSKPKIRRREDMAIAFQSLYKKAKKDNLSGIALSKFITAELTLLFDDYPDLDGYVAEKIALSQRNLWARKKRFRRKAYLNKWNYFVTFTYDDQKHTSETFRTKLRKCLSNLHTRRGWRYMGVFEEAPKTGRLHFHGIFYIPDGEMVGNVVETEDYSTAQHKMQITHINDFFAENFGRNDFEELNNMELKHGQALDYLLKYIDKTGERIVYSRGVKSEVYAMVDDNDIAAEMEDFGRKFILFDDVITWERNVMHMDYKHATIIDLICNPPKVRLSC